MENSSNTSFSLDGQRIALPDKNGLLFFEIRKIVRCQSDNSYTDFYILSNNGKGQECLKVVVSKGFEYFEDFLISKGIFYRVHNQHIINIQHIKKYVKHDGGYLVMEDNSEVVIPVARARKVGLMKNLKSMGIIF